MPISRGRATWELANRARPQSGQHPHRRRLPWLIAIFKKFIAENLHKKKTWDDDWLPCYYGGWATMKPLVQKDFGMSAQGVFDCNCYDLPVSALFQRTGFAASQKTTMEGA
jgi:hypothetical protein